MNTKSREGLLAVIFIIFFFLICLSNVSAEDASDLEIQDSSLVDVSQSMDETTTIDEIDDSSSTDQHLSDTPKEDDYSKDNIKNSSSNNLKSSKLGDSINLNGGTFQDIQDAIDRANPGDTIYLNGGTYNGNGNQIEIKKAITIIGANKTGQYAKLDAKEKSRIFNINKAESVNISNMIFINGKLLEERGGAICTQGTDLNSSNCIFSHNYAYGGAAIMTITSNGGKKIIIENCNFTLNTAIVWGGAVSTGPSYYVYIKNSTFLKNSIENDNKQFYTGGALDIDGDYLELVDSKFISNNAGIGGAINLEVYGGYVINCTFRENSAKNASAILLLGRGNMSIAHCTFENNKAAYRGAIYQDENHMSNYPNISNCHFKNNNGTSGSAIYFTFGGTVDNCTFSENYARSEGAIFIRGNNTQILNSRFENNRAERFGAAIYSYAGSDNIEVDNCQFISNTANNNMGGAIFFNGKNCLISNSLFESNGLPTIFSMGGAIYFDISGNHSGIINCTFKKNSAFAGGAIYWYNDESKKAIIANSTFEQNNASGGGAIYVYGDLESIANSRFEHNNATVSGGAILVYGNIGLIVDSRFEHNYASAGGAINIGGKITLIANSTFKNNKANSTNLTKASTSYANVYTFTGYENYMNAIYASKSDMVNFQNVTYWDGSLVSGDSPVYSNLEAGINVTILFGVDSDRLLNFTKVTNSKGQVFFDEYKYVPFGNALYSIIAYHEDDSYYTGTNLLSTLMTMRLDPDDYKKNILSIDAADAVYGEGVNVVLKTNVSGKYTVYIANSSYDITFTDDDVNRGNILAYNIYVGGDMQEGMLFALPDLLDAKDGYGIYVQFTNLEDGKDYVYTHNRSSFNVRKAGSALDVNGTSVDIGSDAELNYTVENGTVNLSSIKKGTKALVNGTDYNYTITDNKVILKGLDIGDYTVRLTNVVDANHVSKTKDVKVTVNPLVDLSINMAANKNSVDVGDSFTYTINLINLGPSNATNVCVREALSSLVEFVSAKASIGTYDQSTNVWHIDNLIPNNQASLTLTVKAIKSGTIKNTVTVNSTEKDTDKSNNNFTLSVKSKIITNLSAPKVTARYNINKDFVVTLKDSNNNSLAGVKLSVDFNGVKNYTTDSKGQVKIPTKGLSPKNYTVKASFAGNENYSRSNITSKVEIVKDSTKLNGTNVTANYNAGKNLLVSLSDSQNNPIGGAVLSVDLNGVKNYTTDSNGQVKVPIKGLAARSYTAKISFAGNEIYAQSNATYKVTVNKGSAKLTVANMTARYLDNKNFLVTLKDSNGNSLSGFKVSVDLNGLKDYATDSNGQVKISTKNLVPDKYNATIRFAGNENYTGSNASASITINRIKTTFNYKNMNTIAFDQNIEGRVGEYFYFQLLDEDGKPLAGKRVSIGFNAAVYNRTTNETGWAKLQINLRSVNLYTFAIAFLGDDNYEGDFEVALINVTAQTPNLVTTNKIYKSTAKIKILTAAFISSRGTPIVGKKINFIVNGKKYTVKTNSKGIATLKVSLSRKGTYYFSVSYAGDSTYKKINKIKKLTIK